VKKALSILLWLLVAVLGAVGYAGLALKQHEPLNSGYVLLAALCSYAIGYRFYSKWLAVQALMLDDRRATPCEVHEDGKDFVKTNKWIVFGHHFAAISGPGPLVGPVLAAQFGYLPGALWILIGVVLGGAVQDFIILFASVRRDGRSLAQMVREELGTAAGAIGVLAILSIMIILLAVLALVVVKVLAESPWGVFTVGATIPIAMFMGGYLRFWRVGKVLEVSVIGCVLLLLAVWGGGLVHEHQTLKELLKLKGEPLAWSIIVYGLAASVLPVWLLLAPRDYLSTFMKLGTIGALALGVLLVLPDMHMPAVSKFADGTGLVIPGKIFPFCFITIACGTISGFHTLIASGVTPKIITRESHVRSIGYGAMCLESLVAIMALIAACTLEPGVYLAINVKGTPAEVAAKVEKSGFTALAPTPGQPGAFQPTPVKVDPARMQELGEQVKEDLYGRTGGAATLAVGMAQIFTKITGGWGLALWYHFAIMFEALFILTTLDAGTRVGRYLLQDALRGISPRLGNTRSFGAGLFASTLVVLAWGYFLIQGVRDPLGGINSLWPIFGIANQLLASIALCFATTILLKMARQRERSPALALVTFLPLLCLLAVTFTAGWQLIFDEETDPARPKIGFLQAARISKADLPKLETALATAQGADIEPARAKLHNAQANIFNKQLDAGVAGAFLLMALAIAALSAREWVLLLSRRRLPVTSETEPVWLPAESLAEPRPLGAMGAIAIGLTVLRELSGQSAIEREGARLAAENCDCAKPKEAGRRNVYLSTVERKFEKPNCCC
jgi:carbon starvation protein